MRKLALLLLTLLLVAPRLLYAQEDALQPTELLVVVHVAAKLDTLNDGDLQHALLGKDARFDFVGLQEQFYRALLKQMLKTNAGNFEREWLGLISRGKKKRRPLVTNEVSELIALASKNKNALLVLEWRDLKKSPVEHGLKVVRRYRLKP